MKSNTIEKMAPQTKEWFARAVIGMILADGRIEKAEIDYLNDIIGFLSQGDLVKKMSAMLQQNEMPALEPLELVTNEALEIIKHLIVIAVVDEDLADREISYLKYVGDQLGLPADIPDRFLALAKEKLRRARYTARIQAKDFTEQVRCFDLSTENCMFYSLHPLKKGAEVFMQLYKETQNDENSNLYQVITTEVTWIRHVESKHGNYVISVTFTKPINEAQGLGLIKYIHTANGKLESV